MSYPHQSLELKVKAASLAAEARIIRKLEHRLKRRSTPESKKPRPGLTDDRNFKSYISLNNHRRWNIRIEARATHLARAFLRGQDYKLLEKKAYSVPPLKRAGEIALKYGHRDAKLTDAWAAWHKQASTYYYSY